jgi:hypothetical protein
LPGDALLLRVAWMERHDFRAKRVEELVSLANSSAITFSSQEISVWSITLTTNSRRRRHHEDAQESRGFQMNELSKMEQLVAEPRCMM